MSESELYEYNLSTEEKKQSLKLSLSEDKISLILENKSDPNEKYISLISLPELIKVSKAFEKMNSLNEALILLTDTIEAGNIYLIEQEDSINLKFNIKTETEEYEPFSIELILEKQETKNLEENNHELNKDNFEVLPIKFDYQGNKEAEEKYGKTTENTTEYDKPIIKSDYKQPILQLEYIEPILQVHYPDGTTKSKALPPRIQTIDGKTPNINEEQFRYIREQLNQNIEKGVKDKNSKISQYSTSSVPVPSFNNLLGAITNSYNKNISDPNNEINEYQPQSQAGNQTQFEQHEKYTSQYSVKTEANKPIYQQYQDIYNKSSVQKKSPPRNKTIEFKPKMINPNQAKTTSFNMNQMQYQNKQTYLNVSKNTAYQNAISKSQIVTPAKKTLSTSTKNFTGFAQVIPLKQIKRPIAQSQILFQQKKPEFDIPIEFSTQKQKERFQSQLKIQQAIVESKTPKFPSVLPTQIMQTAYEYPQGKNYEEKILAKIKAQDHEYDPYFYNYNQTQNTQSEAQYQQETMTGTDNSNQQNEQQAPIQNNYEEKDAREETLGNNEVIDDNEQEQEQEEQQQEEEQEDYEALYKTEEGYIIFRNGILRGIIHRYSEIDDIISKIQDKLLKGAKFNLLYKAFSDGDKASIFHQKCDGHPISLVLIETVEGVRFGGFTKKSWDGKNLKKKDNDAFVFSIDTGLCFNVKKNEPAIGCYPKFGPVFFGCQIRVYDDFFTKGGTTCLKGLNYNTTKDFELNNGERNFVVKDMEVYEIETIDITK